MTERLGLTEAVAIALGGMIGGGIYAVLGVVTQISGAATWAAFVVAGVVAAAAGYSYIVLNRLSAQRGGSVTFVQCFTGNSTLAGMVGWSLLFGYIGSMAMYAFAFAEFTLAFSVVPATIAGIPIRPLLSVAVVAAFVGLNLFGARATGATENVLVSVKVAVLVAFGVAGVLYAVGASADRLALGFARLGSFDPVVAAAVSFVAFQGWQLLFYDQERIVDPSNTIKRAVTVSIPVAVVIYVLVVVATFNLAPRALQHHPHTALADAAGTVLATVGQRRLGFVVISVSALFSTASAINATLFSTAHFATGMVGNDLLPDRVGDPDTDGVSTRTLVAVGGVTALFSAVGSLEAVTAFASLTFVVVFGAVSLLAFRLRHHESVSAVPPAIGILGTAGFLPLMFSHLARSEPGTFFAVLLLSVATVGVELLYFERDVFREEVHEFEAAVGGTLGANED